ncbi:hypothetical protein AMTR_s00055p00086090 [Amborella trichopoda]|uniref:Uncharacterized protein n=1 Tax=Amborella trichopoda TaxID=13333 RepID=U5CY14_AMBTC|nr:hypothetical protein AMTR_s00055p00086090 [Amborella trichopoda]
MSPWMEEWRDRTAHVIGEGEEEESICLSLYEEKYRLRTAYLGGDQFSGEEVASLRAERDSTIEERDSIAKDLESLRRDYEGMREARDMAEAERDSIKDELERVRAELERVRSVPSSSVVVPTLPGPSPFLIDDLERPRDRCHELLEDVKGLIDKSGKLSRLLLAASGNTSLANANLYLRLPLPSSARSQSQSQASTWMMRSLRLVRQRLEGEASTRTPVVEDASGSRM